MVITAHCDGGSRGNPGPAGFGAILEDEDGNVLARLSQFLGSQTNNFAEYSALIGVLTYAIKRGYKNLRVVSDSQVMVRQIQGAYKVNSPSLKPLCEEALKLTTQLDTFEISHSRREGNKAADKLANLAMDRGKDVAETTVFSHLETDRGSIASIHECRATLESKFMAVDDMASNEADSILTGFGEMNEEEDYLTERATPKSVEGTFPVYDRGELLGTGVSALAAERMTNALNFYHEEFS